jgi:hypothetical protein
MMFRMCRRWRVSALILLASVGVCLQPPSGLAQPAEPVPMKVLRYARYLVAQYDRDGDGRLSPEEWSRMQGDPRAADLDGDGYLTVEELAAYLAEYGARRRIRLMPATVDGALRLPSLLPADDARRGPVLAPPDASQAASEELETLAEAESASSRRFVVPATRLPQGLPGWFRERDLNGDGQVTLAEFAPTGSPAAIEQFRAYDHNGDGVITAREAAAGPRAPTRAAAPADDAPRVKPAPDD